MIIKINISAVFYERIGLQLNIIKNRFIILLLLSSLLLSGCGETGTIQGNSVSDETSSATETLQGTKAAFDEIAASISIDGQDYSLPCKVKDLNSKYTIKDGKYYDDDECTYFSVFSGDEALFAIWVNGDYSTEDAPEPDAVISRILISRDTSENVSFNIMGITEDSTNKDILEILGTPNDTYTDSSYRYVYENNICFFAFNDNDSIKFVSIITDAENYSTEENQNS